MRGERLTLTQEEREIIQEYRWAKEALEKDLRAILEDPKAEKGKTEAAEELLRSLQEEDG